MRHLLILTLCLSACSKNQEAPSSEAPPSEAPPSEAASPQGPSAQTAAPLKPSEATHPFVELEGWRGPAAELSDATEEGLSRCTRIQMVVPATEETPLAEAQVQVLKGLFAKLLAQWDDEKELVPDGCDASFSDRSALSQCSFEAAIGAAVPRGMSEEELAFASQYATIGKVLVTYKYYNPKTAIDDPLFERQCEQLEGDWTAVSVDSPEYQKSVELYAAKAGSTAEAAVPRDED